MLETELKYKECSQFIGKQVTGRNAKSCEEINSKTLARITLVGAQTRLENIIEYDMTSGSKTNIFDRYCD